MLGMWFSQFWNRNTQFLENIRMDVHACVPACFFFFGAGGHRRLGKTLSGTPYLQ